MTDEFYRVKKSLSRYIALSGEVRSICLDIMELEETSQSAGSVPADGMPHERSNAGLEGKVGRIVEMKKMLERKKREKEDERMRIEKIIMSLDSPDQRAVLRCRYLVGMNWYDIADELHYGVRTLFRIHDAGIRSIIGTHCQL